uniref:Uncharacterized protein n=1 Tax=Athene cunicularia TaxID=194338 RepID=A0A663LWH4_ATHCN
CWTMTCCPFFFEVKSCLLKTLRTINLNLVTCVEVRCFLMGLDNICGINLNCCVGVYQCYLTSNKKGIFFYFFFFIFFNKDKMLIVLY